MVLGLGVLAPVGARADAVTGAEFDRAVTAAIAATMMAARAGLIATCRNGEGAQSTLRVAGPSASVTVLDGAVTVKAVIRPESWTLPMNGVLRGYHEESRAAILSAAGLPAMVTYVTGPWGGWSSRYSSPGGTSAESMLDFLLESVLSMGEAPWAPRPDTVFERGVRDDGSVTWSAEQRTPEGEVARAVVVIDGHSQLVFQEVTRERPGSAPDSLNCTMSDVGQSAALDAPDATQVGPLRKLGPAAWRVSTLKTTRDAALLIRRGSISDGGGVGRIRSEARVVVQAMGMQDWRMSAIPGGVRLSRSDPWGGTVAWCVKASRRGIVASACA